MTRQLEVFEIGDTVLCKGQTTKVIGKDNNGPRHRIQYQVELNDAYLWVDSKDLIKQLPLIDKDVLEAIGQKLLELFNEYTNKGEHDKAPQLTAAWVIQLRANTSGPNRPPYNLK